MNRLLKGTSLLIVCLLLIACVLLSGCGQEEKLLDPENPITITVWNYYTGAQLDAFNAHVNEFNRTRGKELGIIVNASSEGSVSDLENNVIAAVQKEVGAKDIPNIFAAYSDTAYKIDQMGLVADLSPYFTAEEKAEYIQGYLAEGDLDGNGSIKIFPIAKSTEIFMLNTTDWDKFSEATGIGLDSLATIEGVTATAKAYYEWSGGQAFFGRDAMANYILIGAMQLGTEIISLDGEGNPVLDFPEDVLRKIWDNYYIPYINGWFSAVGRFRSDDVKIGNIIAFVGSSTSASFFPSKVMNEQNEAYDISHTVLPAPKFENGEPYAIQQGAGMVVTKGTDAQILASVEFLKWFTQEQQNIVFANASGYLPVKKEANDISVIRSILGEEAKEGESLNVSLSTVNENTLYTPIATQNGAELRSILEYSMSDRAKADREAILALVESGIPMEEAVAQYATDENFRSWYEPTKAELESYFN